MSGSAAIGLTAAASQRAALVKRLTTLRGKWAAGNRPPGKPLGRWLGDFLDQEPDGLLPAELELLLGCQNGEDVNKQPGDLSLKESTEPDRIKHAAALHEKPLQKRKDFLRDRVGDYRVRAKFLRFMILGGDKFAPVHEAGIQLWNAAIIGGELDLRSGQCVSRVELANCIFEDDFLLQDATLDVLVLSGSWLHKKFRANRATVSGAMWLDGYFISEYEAELSGIEVGGRLDCSYSHFAGGITAPGAVVKGDLNLSNVTAMARVSFINSDIGGSLFASGAVLTGYEPKKDEVLTEPDPKKDQALTGSDPEKDEALKGSEPKNDAVLKASDTKGEALDFSRAKIRGDVLFSAAKLAAAGWDKATDRQALNAQNITVDGSVTFGGGFAANGEVCFNGAEISKNLDFSAGSFHNEAQYAIRAERAKVAGAFKFNPVGEAPDHYPFESYGCVSLTASQCGDLSCDGGIFYYPRGIALWCDTINVSGSISCGNLGQRQFKAIGSVSFHTAQIGQHLSCAGGRFQNPGGRAIDCQASKIAGCVFLNVASDDPSIDPNTVSPEHKHKWRTENSFYSEGRVTFVGASVGLQFNCNWGCFVNWFMDSSDTGYADVALDLSATTIADTLILGVAEQTQGTKYPDDEPATIKGKIILEGATVRVLKDGGFIDHETRGLRPAVDGMDTDFAAKTLQCTMSLDQFTYDRFSGEEAYDAGKRRAWLLRQPPRDLKGGFKSQPFEQLVNVMRNMGYDDEADDIALFRRQSERRAKPLFRWWRPLRPLRDFLDSYGLWVAYGAALLCALFPKYLFPKLFPDLESAKGFLIQLWIAFVAGLALVMTRWYLPLAVVVLFLFRKFWSKIGELAFLDYFIGYGFRMGRAVVFLLLLVFEFGWFYGAVFNLGAIEPADRDVRIAASQPQEKQSAARADAGEADKTDSKSVPFCTVWSVDKCHGIAYQAIPLFNQWLYSADVMLPVVSFGQKAAWAPTPHVPIIVGTWQAPSNFVYDVQIVETVLGWIEGFLLVSFVTGLISKGGGGKDQ